MGIEGKTAMEKMEERIGEWNGTIHNLLTKRESHTGRISDGGFDIAISQYDPKQAWFIRHLLKDSVNNYK